MISHSIFELEYLREYWSVVDKQRLREIFVGAVDEKVKDIDNGKRRKGPLLGEEAYLPSIKRIISRVNTRNSSY